MKRTYKDAGVDVEEANKTVKSLKDIVEKTYTNSFKEKILTGIGSFNAIFDINKYSFIEDPVKNPVLVTSTDGVGTKLKIAFMMDKHDTIGIDLVAMSINDILTSGAEPLFFLDYISTSTLKSEKIVEIVKGIANGCRSAGCALIGGETAEMPGFYKDDEYDLAGFVVGRVDKTKIINGSNIKEGDVLIGIRSNGVHSNGYSLLRKVFFEQEKMDVTTYVDELDCTLGEELLKPTKIYKGVVGNMVHAELSRYYGVTVKGMAHITGGGMINNIPRMLPKGLIVDINTSSWDPHPIFKVVSQLGNISKEEMFKTFNMGIGFVIAVAPNEKDYAVNLIKQSGEIGYIIGTVRSDNRPLVRLVVEE